MSTIYEPAMRKIEIPIHNQHAYNAIKRNNTLNLEIKNTCTIPASTLVVDWNGNCFICECEAWLPVSVGKITDFKSLSDIWNNEIAQTLQQDIADKKFTYCAVDRCGIVHANKQQRVPLVSINLDESCNLQCPSCRSSAVMLSEGPAFDKKLEMANHLVNLLQKHSGPLHIVMSGNGDPLASAIMRPLIHQFVPGPNQTLRLFTNGLLLKKQLDTNPICSNISEYFISVDAGSKEIYERVRPPGKWEALISNLDFLKDIAIKNNSHVLLKFVLQKNNYKDLANFVDLCSRYQFHGVINRLEDWATWVNYQDHDVIGNVNHLDHAEALEFLKVALARPHDRVQFHPSIVQLAKETN